MSQSPESAPAALPYIYKNPLSGPGLVGGDTFGHGEDLATRPGLVAEGDRFGSEVDGVVRNEALGDETINRLPETGVDGGGLYSAEAVDSLEANKGRMARLGAKVVELASSKRESINEKVKNNPKLSKLAVAATALAFLGGATEQATGENNPVNRTATASATLKQKCISEGLKMPIIRPSDRTMGNLIPKVGIAFTIRQYNRSIPSECNGKYRRLTWVKPEVQNHKKHKLWQGVNGGKWLLTDSNNIGFGQLENPNTVSYEDSSSGREIVTRNPNNMKVPYYRCTPGKGVTKARVKIRTQVRNEKSKKIQAQRIRKLPVKVVGAC